MFTFDAFNVFNHRYFTSVNTRAYVYSLAPERLCAWVSPDLLADIRPANQPRQGKSAPLEKGLTLESGRQLAGEGMGLGVPIVLYPDG